MLFALLILSALGGRPATTFDMMAVHDTYNTKGKLEYRCIILLDMEYHARLCVVTPAEPQIVKRGRYYEYIFKSRYNGTLRVRALSLRHWETLGPHLDGVTFKDCVYMKASNWEYFPKLPKRSVLVRK